MRNTFSQYTPTEGNSVQEIYNDFTTYTNGLGNQAFTSQDVNQAFEIGFSQGAGYALTQANNSYYNQETPDIESALEDAFIFITAELDSLERGDE